MSIGEQIQKFRKECGMTQNELAEKLFVSYQAISQWENGVTKPDIELLPKIAEIFKISIDELFSIQTVKKDSELDLKTFNDDTLYLVMNKGKEILNILEYEHIVRKLKNIEFNVTGDVLNVSSCINVTIKDGEVKGSVNAGADVKCNDILGSVTAGKDINCKNIGGQAVAGTDINCNDIASNATAGCDVNCDNVSGNVRAGCDVNCGDIYGDVRAGCDINCNNIETNDIKADGEIKKEM